jgi:flagellin-like protein
MKRLLRNRKAVSPVVSAVIMILIATIGMSVLFAFFVNYARDFQEGSGSAVLESMVIEDVWFKSSSNIEIWVYNIGKVNFTISNVYINGFKVTIEEITGTSGTVEVEGHESLTVNPTMSGLPLMFEGDNVRYVLKLVTTRGSSIEGSYYWE